jgi:hypothetical protein
VFGKGSEGNGGGKGRGGINLLLSNKSPFIGRLQPKEEKGPEQGIKEQQQPGAEMAQWGMFTKGSGLNCKLTCIV